MPRNAMIVDDDPYIRIAIKELLEPEDITVYEADGAKQCLENMSQGFKGVILMDIMMPEMDGWDTIRAIVDQGYMPDNMIFMLTARETPDEKMLGLQEYIIDYITKPFEPEALMATVEGCFKFLHHGNESE